MKRLVLVLVFLGICINETKAQPFLRKPIANFTSNAVVLTGITSDAPTTASNLQVSGGSFVANGSTFTTNGTSLTKSRPVTNGNGTTLSATVYGNSANQVLSLTLTRFILPPLKTAGGAQANGTLLFTLPAGAQILPGADLTALKVFATNGAAAIKSNGSVLGLGSVKASGAVRALSGTATFINVMTGQQAQFNGRTLNAVTTTPYGTATGGTKTVFLNYANGYPAVTDGSLRVNGTILIPVINLY